MNLSQTENLTYGTKANSDGTIKRWSQQAEVQRGTAANTTKAEDTKQ